MNIKSKFLWLIVCCIEACNCEREDIHGTLISRREMLEEQALRAYQNACYGLQELSNWMSVVFKMKSVWVSSTITQLEANSERNLDLSGQRLISTLPPRPKSAGSQCSLKSAQVTLQTYIHLQGRFLYLKNILGRNFLKISREKLSDANVLIRERIKVLDVFNEALNDIFSKLKQNTRELSSGTRSEKWNTWNVVQDIQDGRFLQLLRIPSNIFEMEPGDMKKEISETLQNKPRGFFQTLGKRLDKFLFTTAFKNSRVAKDEVAIENS